MSATSSMSTSALDWSIVLGLIYIRFPQSKGIPPPFNIRLLQSLPSMKDRYLNKQCFQIAFGEVTVFFGESTSSCSTVACNYSLFFYKTNWRMRVLLRDIGEYASNHPLTE